MPASGSGPTRRSHTKSRNGCKTCKKRHIRCDENLPQCGNCTKHNVRCDYMDAHPAAEATRMLGNPDLQMTPKIQQDLQQWRERGVYPFENLRVFEQRALARYTNTDLRLIHHISSIANQMQSVNEPPQHSIWVSRVPLFLQLATHYDYVMQALLAISASHLGWVTSCAATINLSWHHRGLALRGLREACSDFSRQNADAILAANILLAWQVTDWLEWARLMQGTETVIRHMQPWKQESQFAAYLEEQDCFPSNPHPRPVSRDEAKRVLHHVFAALRRLEPFVAGREMEWKGLHDLVSFVGNLMNYVPAERADEEFELLHPLRMWCFFLPISFLQRGRRDPDVMILLAHFYGVGLAIQPLFPAVGAAYFGSMSLGPVREIHRNLVHRSRTQPPTPSQWPLSLMEFPLDMVRQFCIRMGWKRADEVASENQGGQTYPAGYPADRYSPGTGSSSSSGSSDVRRAYHGGYGHGHSQGYGYGGSSQSQSNPATSEEFYQETLWRG